MERLEWQALTVPPEHHGLPLVSIGGYLRVDSGVAISGDLTSTTSLVPLSFALVHNALLQGNAAGGLPHGLVADVNAESNVLADSIYHADRNQPRGICGRSDVETVLKDMN